MAGIQRQTVGQIYETTGVILGGKDRVRVIAERILSDPSLIPETEGDQDLEQELYTDEKDLDQLAGAFLLNQLILKGDDRIESHSEICKIYDILLDTDDPRLFTLAVKSFHYFTSLFYLYGKRYNEFTGHFESFDQDFVKADETLRKIRDKALSLKTVSERDREFILAKTVHTEINLQWNILEKSIIDENMYAGKGPRGNPKYYETLKFQTSKLDPENFKAHIEKMYNNGIRLSKNLTLAETQDYALLSLLLLAKKLERKAGMNIGTRDRLNMEDLQRMVIIKTSQFVKESDWKVLPLSTASLIEFFSSHNSVRELKDIVAQSEGRRYNLSEYLENLLERITYGDPKEAHSTFTPGIKAVRSIVFDI